MKILHLAYDVGGIHTRLYQDIMSAYRALGHELVEVYLTGTLSPDYQTPATRTVALSFTPAQLKGLRRLWAVRRLRAFLEAENFDVIITHRRKPAEMAARASRGMALRHRFAIWHDEGEFSRWRSCLGAARLFKDFVLIGVSEAVREDILRSRARFHPDKVIAVNNAIDVDQLESHLLSKTDARAALGLPAESFVFGNIGRLVPKKGHADLIRAFSTVLPNHPSAHLVIIGDGRERAELEALVATLQLQANVHLTGRLDGAVRYVAAFDVFVLPSYREGLPIALLEGLCARIPAIVSAIGGSQAVVADLAPQIQPGDIEGLGAALSQMLALPAAERQALGLALYGRLRKYFDRPVMLATYQQLLNPQSELKQ